MKSENIRDLMRASDARWNVAFTATRLALQYHDQGVLRLGEVKTILFKNLGINPEAWRVCGITEMALITLASVKYKRNELSKLGNGRLERGHLKSRLALTEQVVKILRDDGSVDDFKSLLQTADKTVLCLASENSGIEQGAVKFIGFDNNGPRPLFTNTPAGFKFGRAEKDFLKALNEGASYGSYRGSN